jgi:poly(3-hydroxyalkanoate) synthetase
MDRREDDNPWLSLLTAQMAVGREMWESLASWTPRPASTSSPSNFWASPNAIVRELTTLRVREFGDSETGRSRRDRVLVVAPYALHGASLADFAQGHSLARTLALAGGLKPFVTEWLSASPERRFDTIDSLLADLNVAVDDIGAGRPLALIGLCQGGWLAAAYTARFPRKVASLALAGAPIDIAAEPSMIGDMCAMTPISAVDEIIRLGHGLVEGGRVTALWPFASPTPEIAGDVLQIGDAPTDPERDALTQRFLDWFEAYVDLPGAYYRQTFEWIFRENRLARGCFPALGATIALDRIACPLYVMFAENDEIVSPGQATAITRLAGTPSERIETHGVPGRHLSLYMGRRTLSEAWPHVGEFVARAVTATHA